MNTQLAAKKYIHQKQAWCNEGHFKQGLGKPLSNMVKVVEFQENKPIYCGADFGVSECTKCGKRAFTCMFLHLLPTSLTNAVDEFIDYRIDEKQLEEVFKRHKVFYKIGEITNG